MFLYMFRALLCSSSGGPIVLVQHLASSLSLGDCSVHRLWEEHNKCIKIKNLCIKLVKKDNNFNHLCVYFINLKSAALQFHLHSKFYENITCGHALLERDSDSETWPKLSVGEECGDAGGDPCVPWRSRSFPVSRSLSWSWPQSRYDKPGTFLNVFVSL